MIWNLETKLELLAGSMSAREFVAAGGVPWLSQALCCTDVARERLRDWCAAGGMTRPAVSRGAIVERMAYMGTDAVAVPIVLALEAMAPPARDFALQHVLFIGVDAGEAGWCAPIVPVPGGLRKVVVVRRESRSDAGDWYARRTALHELAHAWLEPVMEDAAVVRDRRQARQQAYLSGRYYSELDKDIEYRAWSLVEAWDGPLGSLWFDIRKLFEPPTLTGSSEDPSQAGGRGARNR